MGNGHAFFSKERNVLRSFVFFCKRTLHSLRSFTFFAKKRTHLSFGSHKSPKTRKKRKRTLRALKERKRMMRSERKRKRCPTLHMTLRCRTGGMQDRRDTGKVEFGTVGIQFWLDTGILKG